MLLSSRALDNASKLIVEGVQARLSKHMMLLHTRMCGWQVQVLKLQPLRTALTRL
jgi:hypothetical protein